MRSVAFAHKKISKKKSVALINLNCLCSQIWIFLIFSFALHSVRNLIKGKIYCSMDSLLDRCDFAASASSSGHVLVR